MTSNLASVGRVLASARTRAALSLGVVMAVGATGTFAYWTDDATITGTTFTAGTLDLQVNNGNSYATTTLSMTGMVPGSTSAEVLSIKNNGTVPLKYTLAGGLSGTDAASYDAAGASGLKITIVLNGTRSGTGTSSTCTTGAGTTTLVSAVPLTASTGAAIIAARRPSPALAAAATESLCFQVALDANAPSSLQGKTATATFTATGTSDIS